MQVVESIKKAREKNISDDLILQEIRKQNPEKNPFFEKAIERGATASKILDEIIKQNTPKADISREEDVLTKNVDIPSASVSPPPLDIESMPQAEESGVPAAKPGPLFNKGKSENETTNKTLLTKEAQEEEEDMRKRFLKRIEAKERGEITDEGQFFSPAQTGEVTENSSGQEMVGGASPSSRSPKLIIIIGVGIMIFILFTILIFSLF